MKLFRKFRQSLFSWAEKRLEKRPWPNTIASWIYGFTYPADRIEGKGHAAILRAKSLWRIEYLYSCLIFTGGYGGGYLLGLVEATKSPIIGGRMRYLVVALVLLCATIIVQLGSRLWLLRQLLWGDIGEAARALRDAERARRRTQDARHAETRQMEQEVQAWCAAHKGDPGMTKDKAAEEMSGKLVPLKFRTVRDYLKGV